MCSKMKYPNIRMGTVEAVWNKLGGEDGVAKFLRGELTVSEPVSRWQERDGVIYFTLPLTDGTTGPEWIARLEKKKYNVGSYAKQMLLSPDFKPTTGVINEIAVLKGMLFQDNKRITKNIRAEAKQRVLTIPNAEVACLIRDTFTDDELEKMGLMWIITMHEPINDSGGDPDLLGARRRGDGRYLDAYCDGPDDRWIRDGGFAFVSQVNTLTSDTENQRFVFLRFELTLKQPSQDRGGFHFILFFIIIILGIG